MATPGAGSLTAKKSIYGDEMKGLAFFDTNILVHTDVASAQWLATRRRLLSLLLVAAFAQSACVRGPNISPDQAVAIIQKAPEFRRAGSLVKVVKAVRAEDSLECCFYHVDFVMRSDVRTVPGRATIFWDHRHYWNSGWRLQLFEYGIAPNIATVEVADAP